MSQTRFLTHPDLRTLGAGARGIAAAICVTYGFAKLNGAQFTVLDSELAKPMGEVNGFWLTWHYLGYSEIYGSIIALVQIGGGVLLAWPRTALLGALTLFPVVVNIILTDVLFGIGALPMSILLLVCLVVVVLPEAARLKEAVLPRGVSARGGPAIRTAAVGFLLAGAWSLTYWTANYNNRAPTPIDGVWEVEEGADDLARVFFEYNRAHMAVFRSMNGSDAVRHFEVGAEGEVRVWEEWLAKGPLLYDGRTLGTSRVELRPAAPDAAPLVLRKVEP